MGYDLRITRALDWSANRGCEIPAHEWLATVAADPDLHLSPQLGPFAVHFGGEHWLDWSEGNIYSTDPEREAVAKMLAIATVLGAVVQGDNGEIYESMTDWARLRKRT